MNADYEQGLTDAIGILQQEVERRCKLLDAMRNSMHVSNNGPHVADNDLGGVLNSQNNVYRGLAVSFETAVFKMLNAARKEKK